MESKLTSVIKACTAWNAGVWGRALEAAIERIGPENIAGKSVLEVGASHYSSLAPVFSVLNANATASYLHTSPEPFVRQIEAHFEAHQPVKVRRIDIRKPYQGDPFDIVVAKSVLGTPDFNKNSLALEEIMSNLRSMVAPGGWLLTLDNAQGGGPQLWLKNKLGSGRNGWHYFSHSQYKKHVLQSDGELLSFGFLSFADFGHRGLQALLSGIDRKFDWIVPPVQRSVFVGISRMPSSPSHS